AFFATPDCQRPLAGRGLLGTRGLPQSGLRASRGGWDRDFAAARDALDGSCCRFLPARDGRDGPELTVWSVTPTARILLDPRRLSILDLLCVGGVSARGTWDRKPDAPRSMGAIRGIESGRSRLHRLLSGIASIAER